MLNRGALCRRQRLADLTPGICEKTKRSRRGNLCIELAKGSCSGIPRVGEGLLLRVFLGFVRSDDGCVDTSGREDEPSIARYELVAFAIDFGAVTGVSPGRF